jgi:AhpC/TSA family
LRETLAWQALALYKIRDQELSLEVRLRKGAGMAKRKLTKAPSSKEKRETGNKWKVWTIGAVLFLVTGGLIALVLTQSSTSAQGGPAQVGRQAPDFSLKTFDGQSVSLASLKGKPVLVSFWSPT